MANLAERKRLRELRARPWLMNSVISRLEKQTCRSARLDTPKVVVVEQMAPTSSCDSGDFQESLAKTLDSLSLSAKASRIPRSMSGRSKQQRCSPEVPSDSEDEISETSLEDVSVTLSVGGEQVATSRIPAPSKIGNGLPAAVVAGRKLLCWGERRRGALTARSGVKSREATKAAGVKSQGRCPKSCLKTTPRAGSQSNDSPLPKVHFAPFKQVVWIPSHLKTREFAPQCTRHQRCLEHPNRYTCFERRDPEDEDFLIDEPAAWSADECRASGCTIYPLGTEWFDDQKNRGHDYFSEYGDVLREWYCFDNGRLTVGPHQGRVLMPSHVSLALDTF
jgi:hypothetical protein